MDSLDDKIYDKNLSDAYKRVMRLMASDMGFDISIAKRLTLKEFPMITEQELDLYIKHFGHT